MNRWAKVYVVSDGPARLTKTAAQQVVKAASAGRHYAVVHADNVQAFTTADDAQAYMVKFVNTAPVLSMFDLDW